MAWREEKVQWKSQYHLPRFYFLLNSIRKMDANNVNHEPDNGSGRQQIMEGKCIRRPTWKKSTDQLNNSIIITAAFNI